MVACRLVTHGGDAQAKRWEGIRRPPAGCFNSLSCNIHYEVDELEAVQKQGNQTTGSSEWWRAPLSLNGVCAVEALALSVGGEHVGFHDECEVTDLRAGLSPVSRYLYLDASLPWVLTYCGVSALSPTLGLVTSVELTYYGTGSH